jgi:hypothetical protein
MRTWGRTYNDDGTYQWVEVKTDANGYDDNVNLTALCQVLALNLNESPFFADYGIPQHQTVITQVYPDFYVMKIQQQFASLFASLTISKIQGVNSPQYNIQAVAHNGAVLSATVAK